MHEDLWLSKQTSVAPHMAEFQTEDIRGQSYRPSEGVRDQNEGQNA